MANSQQQLNSEYVVRDETSYLISSANQIGKTTLNYQLREPLVTRPGERFEIAVNQVTFTNRFATITPSRRRLRMLLTYNGYSTAAVITPDGVKWSILVDLVLPENRHFSAEEICNYINRYLDLQITQYLISPSVNDDNHTFCQTMFASETPVTLYFENSTITFYPPTEKPDIATFNAGAAVDNLIFNIYELLPLYADFFHLPLFGVENGKIVITLPPQKTEVGQLDQNGDVTDPQGFFSWHYAAAAFDDYIHIPQTIYGVIRPPAPNMAFLEIQVDDDTKGILADNLAPRLGFTPSKDPLRGTSISPSSDWPNTLRVEEVFRANFYEVDAASTTLYVQQVYENEFSDAFMQTTGLSSSQFVFYNVHDSYVVIPQSLSEGVNLFPYLFQISLPQILQESQEIIGEDNPIRQVIASIPLVSTYIDERLTVAFFNRVFYSVQGSAIRDIQLDFYIDGENYLIPENGMPIYVDLHVRRIYDPSSDRSRANTALYADPYLGFRAYEGNDPKKLILPSGSISHR